MRTKFFLVIFCYIIHRFCVSDPKVYKHTWSDLDTRPLPEWYDRAKIGILLTWGVFSVTGFIDENFWYYWNNGNETVLELMDKFPPKFTYENFAYEFRAEMFDANEWAQLFVSAGAKYVILTSKHREGFTLFASKHSPGWNSVDVGPHRDLVRELGKAVRQQGLNYGLYHTFMEWYHPLFMQDQEGNFDTHEFRDKKLWPEVKRIIQGYKPNILWVDGDGATDCYWNSTDLLAWIYNESPVKDKIVVNDLWGTNSRSLEHGDFATFSSQINAFPGVLQKRKWENYFSLDRKSFGYRRNMNILDVLTTEEIIQNIVITVSCGGNVLINIGPTKDGTIPPIFQERLLEVGGWLKINNEAIYGTSPWLFQNDPVNDDVWYTCRKGEFDPLNPVGLPDELDAITEVYAIVLKWPESGKLTLTAMTGDLIKDYSKVQLIGHQSRYLNWKGGVEGDIVIHFPRRVNVTTDYAWVLKFVE